MMASTLKNQSRRGNISMEIEIVDLESDSFCFTPIKDKGNSKNNAISVELYSEQMDLQFSINVSSYGNPIDLDNYDYDDDDEDLSLLHFDPPKREKSESKSNSKKPFADFSITEPGESSNSRKPNKDASFICEICVEPKQQDDSFKIKGCSHAYCTDCMIKYVASKLQDNVTAVRCPVEKCEGLLEPEYCRDILPKEVFDRWGDALCEAVVLGSQRFYCPFKDCSMLLIDDGDSVVKESECPHCRRLFCAQCKVPWHGDLECGEFQKLHKDERDREDIMLMKLAKQKKWRRCPKCRFLVERTDGCRFMKCRCGIGFCYECGSTRVDRYHYCHQCKR